jgi:hypothetical protein
MLKFAYQLGILKAARDAGFIKEALTLPGLVLLPLLAGGIGAAGGATIGGMLGKTQQSTRRGARTGLDAVIGGACGGVTLPMLGELVSKGKITPSMMKILGALGMSSGALGGGLIGYNALGE